MDLGTVIFIVIITTIIVLCTIGIIAAVKVQQKQQSKYEDAIKAINEKEDENFNYDGSLTPGQIRKKDRSINPDELQKKLYEKFLNVQEKVNKLDDKFDTLLTGFIKRVYTDRINLYKESKTSEKLEDINLLGYSIVEFSKKELKFRLKITAHNYKIREKEVISGSKVERVELTYIITYEKRGNIWKINNIEKVMEKKMEY